MSDLSPRLRAVVDALPLRPGMRVLEVGGAPGAAAREVVRRVGPSGHVVVLDRSERGVVLTERACVGEIAAGTMTVRRGAVEELEAGPGEAAYDLVFAARVGALDGRHPAAGSRALPRIRAVLAPGGELWVDGRRVPL